MAVLVLTLGGCGFEPMLAVRNDTSSVANDLSTIRIATIDNRSGQILRNNLVSALSPRGEPDKPTYTLVVKIAEPRQSVAYQRNDSISRAGYSVSAVCQLYNSNTGQLVYQTGAGSSSTFAVSTSQYATLVSLESTRDRVLLDLSERIRDQIAQFFLSQKPVRAN